MLTPVLPRIAFALAVLLSMLGTAAGAELRVIHLPGHLSDEILVRFKDKASPTDIASAHAWGGGRLFEGVPEPHEAHSRQAAPGPVGEGGDQAVSPAPGRALRRAELHREGARHAQRRAFGQLWGLHNTGAAGGIAGADIDAPRRGTSRPGSATSSSAVIDTGIDYTHPDLAANMFAQRRRTATATASTTTATATSTTATASTPSTTTPTRWTTTATARTSPAPSAPSATTASAWSA